MTTREELLQRIEAERGQWRALVEEVGEGRMEQPGPMGAWSFKDLAAHLTGWRERTIGRLEAPPGAEPPPPWPAELTDDDAINRWIYERNRDRSSRDVLAEADQSFARLASAIRALPAPDLVTPGRFPWMDGRPVVEGDFFGHFREEHEGDVRAWLAGSART
jgi:hypothetical protein